MNDFIKLKDKVDPLIKGRKFQEALEVLENQKEAYISDYKFYFTKAKLQLKTRETSKAISNLRKTVDLHPNSAAYNLLARTYKRTKKINDAKKVYEESLELDAYNTTALKELAYIYRMEGDNDKSNLFYKKAFASLKHTGLINRTVLIQDFIDRNKATNYLEIGVERGINLIQIDAPVKIAVDPKFKIPGGLVSIPNAHFYEMTSDDFFKSDFIPRLEKEGLDIAFVDGLHTYEQSLQDALNCLKYLNEGGIVFMHDCYPSSKAAANPSMKKAIQMPSFTGAWMGDVWKALVWLSTFRDDLHVMTLNLDCGLGVIRKGKPENKLNYTEEEIKNFTYEDFLKIGPEKLINLKEYDEALLR